MPEKFSSQNVAGDGRLIEVLASALPAGGLIATVNFMSRSKTLGEFIGVRCQPDLIEAIDRGRRRQVDCPSRPESFRRLAATACNFSINTLTTGAPESGHSTSTTRRISERCRAAGGQNI
jgi:hypothetical protein